MSEDPVARALGYPYALPGASYVIDKGDVFPLHAEDAPRRREGRTPVLAVGSNQSPDQFARKFPEPDWSEIPCERCVLEDFDTVFSAHITAYGSVPAALHPSPGTRVTLYVNWLDDKQLIRMHDTEFGNANYVYARLNDICLTTDAGLIMDRVQFYRSNSGAFAPAGTPVPLAEVTAEQRRWTPMTQQALQAYLHGETAPGDAFETFVKTSIGDEATRRRRIDWMNGLSEAFQHPGIMVLQS